MQYPKVAYYLLNVLFIGVLKHKEIFHKTATCTLYNVVDCTVYIVYLLVVTDLWNFFIRCIFSYVANQN